jgi:hypothetical protein
MGPPARGQDEVPSLGGLARNELILVEDDQAAIEEFAHFHATAGE